MVFFCELSFYKKESTYYKIRVNVLCYFSQVNATSNSVPGAGKFERSLTNYHLHQPKNTNLNHFAVNKASTHTNSNASNKNGARTNANPASNAKHQQSNLNMSRQNSNLSEIKDFSPLMNRRNSNLTTNSQNQQQAKNSQPQQQHQQQSPPVKPRKTDKRTNSLQRQNSFIAQANNNNGTIATNPDANNNNSTFVNQNNYQKTQMQR